MAEAARDVDGRPARVVILGGGFGGVYAAMELERLARGGRAIDVALVNRENYFVFQPLLAEVVSGGVGVLDTVSPLRRLLPRTRILVRDVEAVDLQARTVTLAPGLRPRPLVIPYDRLVLALGSVTDLGRVPGFAEHAMPFRTLADALALRNHLIHVMEQASIESDPELRRQMQTVVIGGGGFSGTELAAEVNDLVRRAAPSFPTLDASEFRVVLVHSGPVLLDREVSPRLSRYATDTLHERGVEVILNARLAAASRDAAVLDSGRRIPTRTIVATAPSAPSRLVAEMELPKERGRITCDRRLQVRGRSDMWAVGDCALVPGPSRSGASPPTAQHAIRQALVAARNVWASLDGGRPVIYDFAGLGKLGALGHRRAVAELPLGIRVSGFPAWLTWRALYWAKLPGADRKLRVGASWLLDLLIPPDLVQLAHDAGRGVAQARFEPGEIVFRQGDRGDRLYMVLSGEAEIIRESDAGEQLLAVVGPGDYFGEIALLSNRARNATVRCRSSMSVLLLPAGDFRALAQTLPDLRRGFEEVMRRRMEEASPGAEAGRGDGGVP